jgi:serine/threonine-protein kinase
LEETAAMPHHHFDLDPQAWSTLRRLLDEGLAREPSRRSAWIEGLDAPLAEFKPRLRELLLAAPGRAQGLLDTLPKIETADFAPRRSEPPAERIGPYRLLRELGSGGMASVWLAERTDMLQGRPVALKLPHGDWGAYGRRSAQRRAGLAERLAREREILATLHHPNIASLFDAGVADDGQPYLALEVVEGERIDAYCLRHALDVPARLRLFLQAARAVAHAHANLVVHRDLKPNNILVNAQGEVRLLDFGIAKLLDQGRAEETELTRQVGRALTPEYASPEQIRGEAIGTASDVYSLGVVLFELLTGVRPYRPARVSRAALEEAILSAEPVRASDAVAERRLARALRGDLDTIVAKALKKSPADRYATVSALAEDVQRHLDQRAVLAQPDSRAYRLRKFVARNRLAVGAGAAVLAASLAGTGVALWQARAAQAEQRRAEDVKDFIAAIFREANPYRGDGRSASAKDLLQRAADKLALVDAGRTALRVELMNLIGASLMSLQDTATAEAIVMQAVSEARSLASDDPLALEARSLLVSVHRFRGRTQEMKAELERLVPQLRAQAAQAPAPLAQTLKDQAHLAIDEGRYEQAVAAAREAAELAMARLGPDHVQTAACWLVHGLALLSAGRAAEALAASGRALEMTTKIHGGNTAHPQVVSARVPYARALAANGRLEEAIVEMKRAIAGTSTTLGPRTRQVGFFTQNLVRLQLEAGQVKEGLASSELALAILSEHAQLESTTIGGAVSARALAHLDAYDGAQALRDFTQALAVARKVLGPNHDATLRNEAQYLAALAMAGRGEQVVPRLRELAADPAWAAQRSGHERSYWYTFAARLARADDLGRGFIALDPQQRAEARERTQLGPRWALERAHLELRAGAFDAAERGYRSAMEGSQAALVNPRAAEARLGLARVLLERRQVAQALPLLEQADAFWSQFQPANRWAGEAAYWLGRCHAALGQSAAARAALARAAQILEGSPLAGDRELAARARDLIR